MRVIETTLLSNATMLLSTFATLPFFGGTAPAGRVFGLGLRTPLLVELAALPLSAGLSTARAALALTALLVGLAALALTARWVGLAALAVLDAVLAALAVLDAVIILAACAAAPLVWG